MPSSNNLPLQLTSFIGREREIAEVSRLLSTFRLLTLTGAGGSGKTRLALQTVSQLLGEYPDGVLFVNLAPITDHNLVVTKIAQTLGVKEAAGQPLIDTVKAYLEGKEILLLLDNFEQVLGAAMVVMDLLLAAPFLKVIVTSREPLHLQGEQQFLVPPLSLPDPSHTVDSIALSRYEAVMLFVQRAQAAKADFELTYDSAPLVAEICVRLDGLPLAIELAAARISLLPPQAMISRLESRLKLLTGGAHDVATRQHTLRNSIDWSYDLLTGGEKQLFTRLAVFQGGRTLQGIKAVCNADGQLEVEGAVESLLSKNLLQQREGSDGEPRFWMLETIHEYAREKLEENGETEFYRREHALYCMRLAEEAEPQLMGSRQQEWLERLDEEHDNIRAVLAWVREQVSKEVDDNEAVDVGLRTVGTMWRFWFVRGYLSEGRAHMADMLALAGYAHPVAHSISLDTCEARAKAKTLNGAASLARGQGDYTSARSLVDGALMLGREAGDKASISVSLNILGILAYNQGDDIAARTLYEESLALRRELGDKRGIAVSLNNLGLVAQEQGDYTAARALHEQSLALRRETGDKGGIALTLYNLGSVAYNQGKYEAARTLYEESLALRREVGDKGGIAGTLSNLGTVVQEQGEYIAARALHAESLALGQAIGSKGVIAECLARLGRLAVGEGSVEQVKRGAKLLGAVEGLLQSMGIMLNRADRLPYERSVQRARTLLGEEAFQKAWQEGRAMSMEAAIAYALEDATEAEPVSEVASAPIESESSITPTPMYSAELTKREVEVLRLLVEALSNEEIAQRLFLSRNTVISHLYSIYGKLDVPSRSAAARFAVEHSLV